MKKGILITFEGSDGCGKSTQIRRLATRLRKSGLRILHLREPGGTPTGERIRHLLKFSKSSGSMTPETELLLFSASRAQLVREKILPALHRKEIVLCDRYADSTTVYQGFGRGLNHSFISTLNAFAIQNCKPTLTLVLDASVAKGLQRARRKTRTRDRMESQAQSFYQKVRKGFHQLARKEPRRVKIIDATQSIPEVAAAIWQQVKPLLAK